MSRLYAAGQAFTLHSAHWCASNLLVVEITYMPTPVRCRRTRVRSHRSAEYGTFERTFPTEVVLKILSLSSANSRLQQLFMPYTHGSVLSKNEGDENPFSPPDV